MEKQHGLETYREHEGWDIQRFYDTKQIVRKDCHDCYGTGYDENETCGRCQGLGFIELELDRDDIASKNQNGYLRDELRAVYDP